MRKRSCNIFFWSVLLVVPFFARAQLTYFSAGDAYSIFRTTDSLYVGISRSEMPVSSRSLKMRDAQNRLKSIDMMALYLLFTDHYKPQFHTDELFSLFIETGNLHYKADVEGITIDRASPRDGQYAAYRCAISTFDISDADMSSLPNASDLCLRNYATRQTMDAAELVYMFSAPDAAQQIVMTKAFLSGKNSWLPSLTNARMVFPGTLFEESLWGENIAVKSLEYELAAELEVVRDFAKNVLLTQLVTIAEGEEAKKYYFAQLINSLKTVPSPWNSIVCFASENRFNTKHASTLFDAVQLFPGALNLSLFDGYTGALYDKSVEFFNTNNIDSAAFYIAESVNNEGLTPGKLQLAAAIARLQENYLQCLTFSAHAASNGLNTKYVPGNLYIALKALGYPEIEYIKKYFKNEIKCDPWSLSVIQ